MLVPPVLVGGVHDNVMQFLKALTTLGGGGGPGYAEKINSISYVSCIFMCETDFFLSEEIVVTFSPSLNIFCLHYLTDAL